MTMTATAGPTGAIRPRTALVVAGAALFTDMLIYGLAIPVLPLLPATVAAGPAATGALFASYALAMIVVTVPAGRLVDRHGARQPLLLGLVALAVATLLFSTGGPFSVLMAARVLQGTAAGLAWVAGLSLIAAVTPFESRGRAMGLAMGMVTIGVLIGPPLSGALVQAWGPRAPFLLGAALALADGAARVVWVQGSERVTDDIGGPLSVIRVPGTPSVLLVVVVGSLSIAALEPVLPLELTERSQLTPLAIGLLFALMVAVSAVASPIIGGLVSRVDARRLVNAGGILAAGACIGLALARPIWGIAVALVVMGVSNPLFLAPATAIIGQQGAGARPPTMGGAYAAFNLAYAGGLMIGPLVAGTARSLTSFRVTSAALGALVAVGAAVAVFRLPTGRATA
jgi:DHA1 family solute carrier family 18 vesicular amine transporter 1/2